MARTREFDPDEVMEAAMRAFRSAGYEGTSLPDLLTATGLARQSLYNAFGDKHALFVSCLRRFADSGNEALEKALARGRVRTAIRSIFEDALQLPRDELRRGCFVLNSAGEMGARDRDVAEVAAASLVRQERAFAGALRRGVREGELALAPRRIEELARFFVGALQGMRMVARADPASPALGDMAAVALRTLDDAARRRR
jgi:TetR/AcrR family transcriptional regulator, transcriptional repressor for nem operon